MKQTLIIGGGLAGLLAAHQLLAQREGTVTLFDQADPLRASDAPVAICHPFPGRSLQPHNLLRRAFQATLQLMEYWRTLAPEWVHELPMWRPLSGANHDRLRRSYTAHWKDAPSPWLHVALDEANQRIVYGPCFSVVLAPLMQHWRSDLERRGLCYHQRHASLADLQDALSRDIEVILCPGRHLKTWFPQLHTRLEGGELGCFGLRTPLDQLISQAGLHAGPLDDHTLVGGATRWEKPPDYAPDQVLATLQPNLEQMLEQPLRPLEAWRGVRSIYPADRLPIAGPIPHHPGLSVLAALGSKGLLWGPLAAESLASALTEEAKIPHAISTQRMDASAWKLASAVE